METWSKSYCRDISAAALAIWAVLADTANWRDWNPGVKSIQMGGAFAQGSRFAMELPDGDIIHSELTAVAAPLYFTDETWLGDTMIQVEHRIESVGENKSRVIYAVKVEGPQSQAIGEAVSADFPSVLAGLEKYMAEKGLA